MCETKFLPAADGTSCGHGMVGRHSSYDMLGRNSSYGMICRHMVW